MKRTRNRVLVADNHVVISHRVRQRDGLVVAGRNLNLMQTSHRRLSRCRLIRNGLVVSRKTLRSQRRAKVNEVNRLVGILDVRMNSHRGVVLRQRLKCDNRLTVKTGRIELERDVNRTVSRFRRERSGSRHIVVISILESATIRDSTVLIDNLLVQRARHGVLRTRNQVAVSHRIGQGHGLVVIDRNLRLMETIVSRRRGSDVDEMNRLRLVLDVSVNRELRIVGAHRLERNDRLVVQTRAREIEHDVNRTVGLIRSERRSSRNDIAVGILDLTAIRDVAILIRVLQVQRTGQRVLVTRNQVLVLNRIGQMHRVVALSRHLRLMETVVGLQGRAHIHEVDGLALILDILMDGDRLLRIVVASNRLESDNRLTVKTLCVEREGHIDRTVLLIRRERRGRRSTLDGAAINHVALVVIINGVKRTAHGVLATRRQILVLDRIGQGNSLVAVLRNLYLVQTLVGCRLGTDARNMDRLVLVVDIGMDAKHDAVSRARTLPHRVQRIVHNDILTADSRSINVIERQRDALTVTSRTHEHVALSRIRITVGVGQQTAIRAVCVTNMELTNDIVVVTVLQVRERHLFTDALTVSLSNLMIAVNRVGSNRVKAREVHRLVLIINVSVDSVRRVARRHVLESNDGLAGHINTGEDEDYVDRTLFRDRSEGRLSRNGLAIGAKNSLTSILIHQSTSHRVLLTNLKVLVGNRIGQRNLRCGTICLMVDVALQRRADGRNLHRLVLIRDVLMLSDNTTVLRQILERNNGLTAKVRRINVELHGHTTRADTGVELLLSRCDNATIGTVIVHQMQLALHRIRSVHIKVVIRNRVAKHNILSSRSNLIGSAVRQSRTDSDGLVVNRTVVDIKTRAVMVSRITMQRHREVHQLVANVVVATKLLHRVRVVRECTEVIVNGNRLTVDRVARAVIVPLRHVRRHAREPNAGFEVQLAGILHIPVTILVDAKSTVRVRRSRVVGVRVVGMVHPCRTPRTVLVSDDNVLLARRLARYQEGNLVHALHRVLSLLLEVPVLTKHLIGNRVILIRKVNHLTVSTNRERLGVCLGSGIEQVARTGSNLVNLVRTIRQHVVTRGCRINRATVVFHLLRSDGHNLIARLVSLTVHIDSLLRLVRNHERSAIKMGFAKRNVLTSLTVNLTDNHATALNGILVPLMVVRIVVVARIGLIIKVMHLTFLTDGECLRPVRIQITFGSCALDNLIRTVRKNIVSRSGNPALRLLIPRRGNRHDNFARLIQLVTNHNGICGLVHDVILRTLERRVALSVGRMPVGIGLRDGNTTAIHLIDIVVRCGVLQSNHVAFRTNRERVLVVSL